MQRNNLKRKRPEEGDDDFEPGLSRQMLPVATHLSADFDGIPKDGAEYLFTVRRSAASLPFLTQAATVPAPVKLPPAPWVMQAKVVQARMKASPDAALDGPSTSPGTSRTNVPSDEWKELFVQRFRCLRRNVQQPTIHVGRPPDVRFPKVTDRAKWYAFINGREQPQAAGKAPDPHEQEVIVNVKIENDTGAEGLDYSLDQPAAPRPPSVIGPIVPPNVSDPSLRPNPPTTAILRTLDQKSLLHLLMYLAYWLSLTLHPPTPTAPSYPSSAALTPLYAQWIFALLAFLDDRLLSGEIHTLRTLARACGEVLRRGEGQGKWEGEREACWMVLAAVAGVWGQSDLWEDAREAMVARR